MAYIESKNIKVFPAAGRSDDYPEGFLTTEDNLRRFITTNYEHNNSSFIINESVELPLKFVINGYYFEISELPEGVSLTNNLYAAIFLLNELTDKNYIRLVSTDESQTSLLDITNGSKTEFKGLFITNNEDEIPSVTSTTTYKLQILEDGNIIEKNKYRYSTSDIIDETSGKTIDKGFTTGDLNVDNLTASTKIESKAITSESITTDNLTVNNKITTKDLKATNIETENETVSAKLIVKDLDATTVKATEITADTITASKIMDPKGKSVDVSNLLTDVDMNLSVDSKTLVLGLTKTRNK